MTIKKILTAYHAARDFGLGWTLRRLVYELKLRTGWHRRTMPKRPWQENEVNQWLSTAVNTEQLLADWRASQPKFLFGPEHLPAMQAALSQFGEVAEMPPNAYAPRFFSKVRYQLTADDCWFVNPFTEPRTHCVPDKHWSEYPMYSKTYEDLKFIWEFGRFAIVYDWVRAYARQPDTKWAEHFWTLVESWIDHNPPNTGPHWKCGQETSLRLMAWYVGLFTFLDDPATTPERFARFLGAVAAQADRVARDWRYSYLQQSNHAASEGLGLYVTGTLFPQLAKAAEWRKHGKYILQERITFLFRPDGTYFQKSHNYLRFIIHAYLYAVRVAELNSDDFGSTLRERLKAAHAYLAQVMDETGMTPNFGSNDGALILPLNNCDYRDFRPTLSQLQYYLYGNHCYEQGPWHEDLVWIFGPEAINLKDVDKQEPQSLRLDHSGIYTLRQADTWVFTHAETFIDRPAHADALHLDVWWRGINICTDPGTYLYYGHTPWLDAWKHTRFHNTVTVDGLDQMERAYRFTWAHWHASRCVAFAEKAPWVSFTVEHDGYHRLPDAVTHRRRVIGMQGYWIVIDDLQGAAAHDYTIHWLMPALPFTNTNHQVKLQTSAGDFAVSTYQIKDNALVPVDYQVHRPNDVSPTVARTAYYYGHLEDALYLTHEGNGALPLRLITLLGDPAGELEMDRTLQLKVNNEHYELAE